MPVDVIESARRERAPLEKVAELVVCGEIRSANVVAALLRT
ncbi:hypothetical protein ACH4TV_05615 [Streptomyces sp. NPDC020898]